MIDFLKSKNNTVYSVRTLSKLLSIPKKKVRNLFKQEQDLAKLQNRDCLIKKADPQVVGSNKYFDKDKIHLIYIYFKN